MSLTSSLLKLLTLPASHSHRRRSTAPLAPALVASLESRVLLSSLPTPAVATPPADFDADWRINGVNTFILTIHQDGNQVTGGFNSSIFAYEVKGKVNGNVMTIKGKSTASFKGHFKAQVGLSSPTNFSGVITSKIQGTPKSNGTFDGVRIS